MTDARKDSQDPQAPRPAAIPHVSARRLGPVALPIWVRGVILLCCVAELALIAASFFGYPIARHAAVMLGGFWSPVLWAWQGVYAEQPVVMFLSYGLLHAGLLHLAMNMIALAALARELNRLIGPWSMAVIYLVSQIAGALAFAWLNPQAGPMIGASGAVFGIAGALVVQIAMNLRRRRQSTAPLVRAVAVILGLNVALTLLMPSVAWQAHLGGGVAGLILGAISGPRRA